MEEDKSLAAEKNFENKIKEYLTENGAWFIKYWAGAAYTKAGIPDILACLNGIFLGIEVKAVGGKPSDLQIVNIREIRKAGGIAIILYPYDYDAFIDLCESIKTNDLEYAKAFQLDFDELISESQKEILYK